MKHIAFLASSICIVLATGCSPSPSASPSDNSTVKMDGPPPSTSHTHSHSHEESGPNGGTIIELGSGSYHAELVHDASSVTIYILDGSAKNPVPISATELTINLLQDDKPQQYKLAAQSKEGEAAGHSSRFVSTDTALTTAIEEPKAAPKLNVTIDGKPYRAELAHHH